MGKYYRYLICTIAATRASDSFEGFFSERLGQWYQVQTCEIEAWNDSSPPKNEKWTVHTHPNSMPNWSSEDMIEESFYLAEDGYVRNTCYPGDCCTGQSTKLSSGAPSS
jgi:hypothetical protein